MSNDTDDEDCKVGYCNPPKHTQYKKGQSGNPAGRPKDSRNIKTVLRDVLREKVLIKEDGKELWVTKQEAIVRRLTVKSMNGGEKATQQVIDLCARAPGNMNRFGGEVD